MLYCKGFFRQRWEFEEQLSLSAYAAICNRKEPVILYFSINIITIQYNNTKTPAIPALSDHSHCKLKS